GLTVDSPHGVVRNAHLELHDRLEQHRIGSEIGGFPGHRAGDLERHLGRGAGGGRAVDERHPDALYWRARELPVMHRLLDALVHRWAEALWDDTTDDLVDELVLDLGCGRDHDVAVAELAATAGLFLVAPVCARLAADRLAVPHSRRGAVPHVDAEERAAR